MSLRVKLIAAFLLLAILTLGAITVYSYCDREIEPTTPPEAYLTLFMGVLDTRSNTLRYVNAGHHTQFALRSTGTPERSEDPAGSEFGHERLERLLIETRRNGGRRRCHHARAESRRPGLPDLTIGALIRLLTRSVQSRDREIADRRSVVPQAEPSTPNSRLPTPTG